MDELNFFDIVKLNQNELKDYLKNYLKDNGYDKKIINTEKYLLGIGEIPIMVVAHLDTVHRTLPKTILFDKKQRLVWSPEGIGGDDRCGVYAIMKLIQNYKPYVLFTTDEEIGGIGATAFTKDVNLELKKYVGFIIEIDRRGSEDAVFYNCGNKEFKDYILSFGFSEEWGTFSDISILSPAYDIASVNLSSGYYNEHQNIEYVNLKELGETIKKVGKILGDEKNHKWFNYQEEKFSYYNNYAEKYEKEKEEDIKVVECEEYDDYIGDSYYDIMKSDYEKLSNKKFKEYYSIDKPATLEEFLEYMGY